MKRSPAYKIGTKVRTIRPVFFHRTQEEIPVGTIGEINGVGLDAEFGYYSCKFGKNESMLVLAPFADPHCEIVE